MSDTVIGHGPKVAQGPYIPDFLLVEGDGPAYLMGRAGGRSVLSPRAVAQKTATCGPEALRPGMWPMVFAAGDPGLGLPVPRLEWFSLEDEAAFRERMAHRVLGAAKDEFGGDPLKVVAVVAAAGSIMDLDVKRIMTRLLDEAGPGEDLMSVYDRVSR